MSQLAKKGFYLRTFDRDVFLTKEQKDSVRKALDGSQKYFTMNNGDTLIMLSQIKEIVPAEEYKVTQSGGYFCTKHPTNFVPKGKKCGYCG